MLMLSSPKTTILSPPPPHASRKFMFSCFHYCSQKWTLSAQISLACGGYENLPWTRSFWVTSRVLWLWFYDVMKIHFIFTWKELGFAYENFIISTVKAMLDFLLDCRVAGASKGWSSLKESLTWKAAWTSTNLKKMCIEPCVIKYLKPRQGSMGGSYLNALISSFLNRIHLSRWSGEGKRKNFYFSIKM